MTKLPVSSHRLFDAARHATFVTTNADGTPHVSLMWISRDGDDLVFGVEGHRRKTANLRRDPHVTVMVEDTEDSPQGLRQHLVVRGTVTFDGPGIPDEFAAFMDRQAHRYLGTDYPFANRHSTTALIGRIRPDKVSGIGPWA